ncbi:ABC transporter ATP-binding protein [Pinisolibacter aquiterrae]|uniref:ABC transporter ATP-binding protein n=1 Tax=Pinisolibacter aquiterrae TaxID=2815579 RepID=UPI001C3D2615|nr:sn-glycerol-3-phosphate ABC transporter ATP-binding protein UgpC [Pinisolibacter aquiterrae]MBV5265181.1 sn-glycerol-3-phosphate ABC transporter ATP-binding protein UgpC [Pinisolibacter aquiterrae]MCC8235489.1 sn-glycerol-3-phosphate ABC transporter ATP-binding protein UgpC [Pinisolibacter aquiterrae]
MADISIRKVAKSYGKTSVVEALDLDIHSGEFIVVLGPSGCGKSTLLRMIAGLEEISAGDIAIDGTIVNRLEPRERGCAMVFQNYALYPHMSVADNMGYALKVAGVAKAERLARIGRVAETLGLTALLDRRPAQLSGGQRQRVAMGRAMIREPKVFLFDEPLSNLDAKLRVQMRIEIRKLHNRLSATSIFVTHDQVEAMTLADRIVVMNAGKVEQIGTPLEIWHRPASRFVAGFVGMPPMNLLEATVETDTRVRLADGTPIDTPPLALRPGTPVVIGIRAEDVRVGAAVNDPGLVLAVDFVEQLGAAALVHGRFGGHDFVVTAPAALAEGAPEGLALGIDPPALHLFDAATGRRLATVNDAAALARPAVLAPTA